MQKPNVKSSFSFLLKSAMIVMIIMIEVNAQSVDAIVAKNLKARGGIEKIKAIKTQRIVGEISFGSDPVNSVMV